MYVCCFFYCGVGFVIRDIMVCLLDNVNVFVKCMLFGCGDKVLIWLRKVGLMLRIDGVENWIYIDWIG